MAIHELAARYGNVIDDRNWDDLPLVFSDDATFEIRNFGGIDRRTAGLAAIRQMLADTQSHPVAHHVTNVEVRSKGSTVHLFFKIVGTGRRGRVGSADYRDIIRRDPGGWRIVTHVATLRRSPEDGNR